MTSDRLESDLARYFAAQDQGCGHEEQLAQHLAGELPTADSAAFRKHLAGCEVCSADLRELEQASPSWVAAPDAAVLRFPSRLRLFLPLAAVLLAGLVSLVLFGGPGEGRLRAKGTWLLEVAAQRDGKSFRAPSGTLLQEGDSLGFFYSSERAGYLIVVYADGHTPPVRLFPAEAKVSAKIEPGSQVSLPDGAKVGPGTDCEWIIGLFTERPLSAEEGIEAAQQMVNARHGCTLGSPDAPVTSQVITVKR